MTLWLLPIWFLILYFLYFCEIKWHEKQMNAKNKGLTLAVSEKQHFLLNLSPTWLALTFPQQTIAPLSRLFNHFLTYPKYSCTLSQTHPGACIELNQSNLRQWKHMLTLTHTHACTVHKCRHTAEEGNEQQYRWCDTVLRMPGQS